jgi:uracil phosphoribosyltransferase
VDTTEGISRVLGKYPRLHICTASVAEGLTASSYIKRSVGDFGDRYFTE